MLDTQQFLEQHAPNTIAGLSRHEFLAQLNRPAGSTVTYPRPNGRIGHPTIAPTCGCPTPLHDDGTCIRCGHTTP